MTELSPGTRVQYSDGRQGVVRFIGTTHFSTGQWVGIELDDGTGKNDGTVQGQRYFQCDPGHGMFVRPDSVMTIADRTPSAASEKRAERSANGSATRSRQSVMSAETARKRQSLMGSGTSQSSRPVRLSLRSPTKSPTKPLPAQDNSSGQSSPGVTTPTTTARTSNSSTKSRLSISGRPPMGPPPPPTSKAQTRPSIGTTLSKATRTDPFLRTSRPSARPSIPASHLQILSTGREQSSTRSMASEETPVSPSFDEEEEEGDYNEDQSTGLKKGESVQLDYDHTAAEPQTSPRSLQGVSLESSTLQAPANGLGSAQAKPDNAPPVTREVEQMKAKYKIMERKRMEDRDKLKSLEALTVERDKFESAFQKLQRKCQSQSQEIAEWRRQLKESEALVEKIEKREAAYSTEVEHLTIDKEMVEERLEAATAEMQLLQVRCEELEIDAELARQEVKEFTSGMTSEERSDAGWLQMQKENERLRHALVALRDTKQETEIALKSHVKELEDDLGQFEALKSEYQQTKTKLEESRVAVQSLKENLEAADQQDLLITQVTEEKEALMEQINLLSAEVMRLKEDAELSREILDTQNSTEKLLQGELDDVKELALERDQKTKDQAKVIDGLEYTLLRFKEVADGLQKDLQELQANKQVSEIEAHELSAKSRAMIDLNLRLQSTATKTYVKKLEAELNQIKAEDTALHLAVIQYFLPANFTDEKDPVLALLRFKRIASKASLLRHVVEENIDHSQGRPPGDLYASYDMIEKLQWVKSCCSRCHSYMTGCTVGDFSKFNVAVDELGPVERALDLCIDAAKRQDMDSARCAQDLQRMIALLSDLAEKTVPSSPETFADAVTARSQMMQMYSDIAGLELDLLNQSVRKNVVRSQEDDGLQIFSQEIQRLVERSRISRVIAGKVLRALDENRSRSMTLGEDSLILFEDAESVGKNLSELSRTLGQALFGKFEKDAASDASFNLDDISRIMQESAMDWLKDSSSKISEATDPLGVIAGMLSEFHSKVEGLLSLASDLSKFTEFERHPEPWAVRAKTLKEQKVVDKELEEKFRRLQSQSHEQKVTMSAKNKQIEEQSLKIELLEARSKGAKDHASAVQKLEAELAEVIAERDRSIKELEDLTKQKQALSQRCHEASARLATLNQNIAAGDLGAAVAWSSNNETQSLQLAMEIQELKEEIVSLQSAVRFLKAENHRLLHPVSPTSLAATNHAWLEVNPLPKPGRFSNERDVGYAVEAKDVFSRLLEVSSQLKPLQLQRPSEVNASTKQTSWRPIKQTPRYFVSHQREEFEKWKEWRDDLIQRAAFGQRRKAPEKEEPPSRKTDAPGTPRGQFAERVEIVGSPP